MQDRRGVKLPRPGQFVVGDKLTTITLEAIGDDKVRVNHQSWTDAVVIRADEALEVLALGYLSSICDQRVANFRGDRIGRIS